MTTMYEMITSKTFPEGGNPYSEVDPTKLAAVLEEVENKINDLATTDDLDESEIRTQAIDECIEVVINHGNPNAPLYKSLIHLLEALKK